jgi:hypothetical protein
MPWSLTRMAFAVDDTPMSLTNEQMSVRFAWFETLRTDGWDSGRASIEY